MKVIDIKGVEGPYKNEQAFKKAVLKAWREENPSVVFFEIENPEKEPGMPDVIGIGKTTIFTEFKFANSDNYIKFQKTQPLWYKKYAEKLDVGILAWKPSEQKVVFLSAKEVVDSKSLRIKI